METVQVRYFPNRYLRRISTAKAQAIKPSPPAAQRVFEGCNPIRCTPLLQQPVTQKPTEHQWVLQSSCINKAFPCFFHFPVMSSKALRPLALRVSDRDRPTRPRKTASSAQASPEWRTATRHGNMMKSLCGRRDLGWLGMARESL